MSDALDRVAKLPPQAWTYEVRPVASPSAGADFSITCNDGGVWRVLALTAKLVTSAAVANRAVQLQVDDQSTVSMKYPAGAVQAAGVTVTYSWLLGYPVQMAAAEAGLIAVPITDFVLHPGWRVRPVTALLDVGDQWSAITLTIERIVTPPHTITQRLVDAMEYDDEVQSIAAAGGFPQ